MITSCTNDIKATTPTITPSASRVESQKFQLSSSCAVSRFNAVSSIQIIVDSRWDAKVRLEEGRR
jgi:hypothetical protein